MNAVFADTSFYVAAVSPKDAFHTKAMQFVRQYTGTVVTTEHVLIETGNWFARTQDRGLFLDLLDSIQTDPKTTVIWSARKRRLTAPCARTRPIPKPWLALPRWRSRTLAMRTPSTTDGGRFASSPRCSATRLS